MAVCVLPSVKISLESVCTIANEMLHCFVFVFEMGRASKSKFNFH